MHTQIQIEQAQSRLANLRRLLGQFLKIFMKTEKTTQVTLQVQHFINTTIQEMLQKDIIELSSSE